MDKVEIYIQERIKGTKFEGKVFTVGGFLRDEILGIPSKDIDILVNVEGGAKELAQMLGKAFPLGNGYPIWSVDLNGIEVEIAETMSEQFPDPNSRQREVRFGTLQEDIMRRDFSINMFIRDISKGFLIDGSGHGFKDLLNKELRCHKDVPLEKILSEDPLRMMRLVRFVVKYGMVTTPADRDTIRKMSQRIQIVSAERVRDELVKTITVGKLPEAINYMNILGLMPYVMPEIKRPTGLFVFEDWPDYIEGAMAALAINTNLSGPATEALMRRLKFTKRQSIDTAAIVNAYAFMQEGFIDYRLHVIKAIRKYGTTIIDQLLPFLGPRFENTTKDLVQNYDWEPLVKSEDLMAQGFSGPVLGKKLKEALDIQDENNKFTKEQIIKVIS
jgi:tRNA nucleotidyltransferase/poly(A) polymerase